MSDAPQPLKLFISYSHEDEDYRQKLGRHLTALQIEGYYEVWHDRALLAGQDWAKEIDSHLAEADVVLLLVSADLINSRYVWGLELEQALRQEAAGTTRIVSVILKPCRWHRSFSPLASRQALPPRLDRVKSVSEHPGGEEKAFDEVMEGLEKLYEDIRSKQPRAPTAPGAAAGRLRPTDKLKLHIGRHPWHALAALGAAVLTSVAFVVHGQLAREAEFGWRLLRIGEYAEADRHFTRARWWPGLDKHGTQIAYLGLMLPRLIQEPIRREFDRGLADLEQAAPASGFVAYFKGVAKFGDWRRERDTDAAARLMDEMQALYTEAVTRDPELAEAHAQLSMRPNFDCRLDAALAAIRAAEKAGGSPPPARYSIQKAEILARFDDEAHRRAAAETLETLGNHPQARLQQAMLAWEEGKWAHARDLLADALALADTDDSGAGWLLFLPDAPWLVGEPAARRCLLHYASAVGEQLASGGSGTQAAWNTVAKTCPRLTEDARDFLCAHLPENAFPPSTQARRELACPSPQPLARCAPADNTPPAPRPQI